MTGRPPRSSPETLDASLIFHGCGRHNHDPTAASVCGDGLKIVWTSEVASTGKWDVCFSLLERRVTALTRSM
jgi:hypothetical protein